MELISDLENVVWKMFFFSFFFFLFKEVSSFPLLWKVAALAFRLLALGQPLVQTRLPLVSYDRQVEILTFHKGKSYLNSREFNQLKIKPLICCFPLLDRVIFCLKPYKINFTVNILLVFEIKSKN